MTTKITDPSGRTIKFTRGADGDVHVLSRHSAGHIVLIGPLNPAEVRRALDAECPSKAETPQPAQTGKPTAEDFAQAKFARHEDGRIAARMDDESLPWRSSSSPMTYAWLSDADMADNGWQIVTPAPTTARDLLAMLPDLCYEPEDGKIPKDTGLIEVWDDGGMRVVPDGYICGVAVRGAGFRRLLLDPPATMTPEWYSARIVEARVLGGDRCQWASTTDDMWVSLDGSNFATHRDYLHGMTVIVPEEVEA